MSVVWQPVDSALINRQRCDLGSVHAYHLSCAVLLQLDDVGRTLTGKVTGRRHAGIIQLRPEAQI